MATSPFELATISAGVSSQTANAGTLSRCTTTPGAIFTCPTERAASTLCVHSRNSGAGVDTMESDLAAYSVGISASSATMCPGRSCTLIGLPQLKFLKKLRTRSGLLNDGNCGGMASNDNFCGEPRDLLVSEDGVISKSSRPKEPLADTGVANNNEALCSTGGKLVSVNDGGALPEGRLRRGLKGRLQPLFQSRGEDAQQRHVECGLRKNHSFSELTSESARQKAITCNVSEELTKRSRTSEVNGSVCCDLSQIHKGEPDVEANNCQTKHSVNQGFCSQLASSKTTMVDNVRNAADDADSVTVNVSIVTDVAKLIRSTSNTVVNCESSQDQSTQAQQSGQMLTESCKKVISFKSNSYLKTATGSLDVVSRAKSRRIMRHNSEYEGGQKEGKPFEKPDSNRSFDEICNPDVDVTNDRVSKVIYFTKCDERTKTNSPNEALLHAHVPTSAATVLSNDQGQTVSLGGSFQFRQLPSPALTSVTAPAVAQDVPLSAIQSPTLFTSSKLPCSILTHTVSTTNSHLTSSSSASVCNGSSLNTNYPESLSTLGLSTHVFRPISVSPRPVINCDKVTNVESMTNDTSTLDAAVSLPSVLREHHQENELKSLLPSTSLPGFMGTRYRKMSIMHNDPVVIVVHQSEISTDDTPEQRHQLDHGSSFLSMSPAVQASLSVPASPALFRCKDQLLQLSHTSLRHEGKADTMFVNHQHLLRRPEAAAKERSRSPRYAQLLPQSESSRTRSPSRYQMDSDILNIKPSQDTGSSSSSLVLQLDSSHEFKKLVAADVCFTKGTCTQTPDLMNSFTSRCDACVPKISFFGSKTESSFSLTSDVNILRPLTIYGSLAAEINEIIDKARHREREYRKTVDLVTKGDPKHLTTRRCSLKKEGGSSLTLTSITQHQQPLSPKDLEKHISKLISQNAAIVFETNPIVFRRFSKESKASARRFSLFDLGRSKLQTALLAGNNVRRMSSVGIPASWSRTEQKEASREAGLETLPSSVAGPSSGAIREPIVRVKPSFFTPLPSLPSWLSRRTSAVGDGERDGAPDGRSLRSPSGSQHLMAQRTTKFVPPYSDVSASDRASAQAVSWLSESVTDNAKIGDGHAETGRILETSHVSVIKKIEVAPLKKRKFSEPVYDQKQVQAKMPDTTDFFTDSGVSAHLDAFNDASSATSYTVTSPSALDQIAGPASSLASSTAKATDLFSVHNCRKPIEHQTKLTFVKSARPTTLELPERPSVLIGSNLISPDTPRPLKAIRQTFIDGHAYTTLGLKVSTRSTYCCIYRPQPMFVLQETDPRLSMYSNWVMCPFQDELKLGVEPIGLLACTDHRQWRHDQQRPLCTMAPREMASLDLRSFDQNVVAGNFFGRVVKYQQGSKCPLSCGAMPLYVTHSSYWLARMAYSKKHSATSDYSSTKEDFDSVPSSRRHSTVTEPGSEIDSSSLLTDESAVEEVSQDEEWNCYGSSSNARPKLKRVKICEGGYKSNEDYTYVRGRGRGKYVCEECGIRCKKPSMLKKHIRTHTDLRPFFCTHCEFAFKTKGNLTKHMKSKAHHKRCVELGIVPVPIHIDDCHIDHEQLAKQVELRGEQPSEDDEGDDEDDEQTDSESEGSEHHNGGSANCTDLISTNVRTEKQYQDYWQVFNQHATNVTETDASNSTVADFPRPLRLQMSTGSCNKISHFYCKSKSNNSKTAELHSPAFTATSYAVVTSGSLVPDRNMCSLTASALKKLVRSTIIAATQSNPIQPLPQSIQRVFHTGWETQKAAANEEEASQESAHVHQCAFPVSGKHKSSCKDICSSVSDNDFISDEVKHHTNSNSQAKKVVQCRSVITSPDTNIVLVRLGLAPRGLGSSELMSSYALSTRTWSSYHRNGSESLAVKIQDLSSASSISSSEFFEMPFSASVRGTLNHQSVDQTEQHDIIASSKLNGCIDGTERHLESLSTDKLVHAFKAKNSYNGTQVQACDDAKESTNMKVGAHWNLKKRGNEDLSVGRSREHEAARSLLDLAKPSVGISRNIDCSHGCDLVSKPDAKLAEADENYTSDVPTYVHDTNIVGVIDTSGEDTYDRQSLMAGASLPASSLELMRVQQSNFTQSTRIKSSNDHGLAARASHVALVRPSSPVCSSTLTNKILFPDGLPQCSSIEKWSGDLNELSASKSSHGQLKSVTAPSSSASSSTKNNSSYNFSSSALRELHQERQQQIINGHSTAPQLHSVDTAVVCDVAVSSEAASPPRRRRTERQPVADSAAVANAVAVVVDTSYQEQFLAVVKASRASANTQNAAECLISSQSSAIRSIPRHSGDLTNLNNSSRCQQSDCLKARTERETLSAVPLVGIVESIDESLNDTLVAATSNKQDDYQVSRSQAFVAQNSPASSPFVKSLNQSEQASCQLAGKVTAKCLDKVWDFSSSTMEVSEEDQHASKGSGVLTNSLRLPESGSLSISLPSTVASESPKPVLSIADASYSASDSNDTMTSVSRARVLERESSSEDGGPRNHNSLMDSSVGCGFVGLYTAPVTHCIEPLDKRRKLEESPNLIDSSLTNEQSTFCPEGKLPSSDSVLGTSSTAENALKNVDQTGVSSDPRGWTPRRIPFQDGALHTCKDAAYQLLPDNTNVDVHSMQLTIREAGWQPPQQLGQQCSQRRDSPHLDTATIGPANANPAGSVPVSTNFLQRGSGSSSPRATNVSDELTGATPTGGLTSRTYLGQLSPELYSRSSSSAGHLSQQGATSPSHNQRVSYHNERAMNPPTSKEWQAKAARFSPTGEALRWRFESGAPAKSNSSFTEDRPVSNFVSNSSVRTDQPMDLSVLSTRSRNVPSESLLFTGNLSYFHIQTEYRREPSMPVNVSSQLSSASSLHSQQVFVSSSDPVSSTQPSDFNQKETSISNHRRHECSSVALNSYFIADPESHNLPGGSSFKSNETDNAAKLPREGAHIIKPAAHFESSDRPACTLGEPATATPSEPRSNSQLTSTSLAAQAFDISPSQMPPPPSHGMARIISHQAHATDLGRPTATAAIDDNAGNSPMLKQEQQRFSSGKTDGRSQSEVLPSLNYSQPNVQQQTAQQKVQTHIEARSGPVALPHGGFLWPHPVITSGTVVPTTTASSHVPSERDATGISIVMPPCSVSASSPSVINLPTLERAGPSGLQGRCSDNGNSRNLGTETTAELSKHEESQNVCTACRKSFRTMPLLRMHLNIHYMERQFRCNECLVSFRTKGHLQKHKRSSSHANRVSRYEAFGTPTADNPRPFGCKDCKIAFRIHGHLAKHLRSKMHIMKLECIGKLPFGMFAELERNNISMNDIDTTDCDSSLESLQKLAHRLYPDTTSAVVTSNSSTASGYFYSSVDQRSVLSSERQLLNKTTLTSAVCPSTNTDVSGSVSGINEKHRKTSSKKDIKNTCFQEVSRTEVQSYHSASQSILQSEKSPTLGLQQQPTTFVTAVNSASSQSSQRQSGAIVAKLSENTQIQSSSVQHEQRSEVVVFCNQDHATKEEKPAAQVCSNYTQKLLIRPQHNREEQAEDTASKPLLNPNRCNQSSLPSAPSSISQRTPTSNIPRSSCTCSICGKILKSAKSLQVHLHTEHAEEQRIQCEIMEPLGLAVSDDLKQSSVTTQADKQQEVGCSSRNQAVASLHEEQGLIPSSVDTNNRRNGASANENGITCSVCGVMFANALLLQKHSVACHSSCR